MQLEYMALVYGTRRRKRSDRWKRDSSNKGQLEQQESKEDDEFEGGQHEEVEDDDIGEIEEGEGTEQEQDDVKEEELVQQDEG